MGKHVKNLTDVTCGIDFETGQVVTITVDVEDTKLLIDKNGFVVVKDGKIDVTSSPEQLADNLKIAIHHNIHGLRDLIKAATQTEPIPKAEGRRLEE